MCSHAWGREKGFHNVLVTAVCERRGEVERKRRSDAGKILSPNERAVFREKLKKARTTFDTKEVDDPTTATEATEAINQTEDKYESEEGYTKEVAEKEEIESTEYSVAAV